MIAVGRAAEAIAYLDLALDVHQDEYGHGTWRTRGLLRQKFLALVATNQMADTQSIWHAILKSDAEDEAWEQYFVDIHWFAGLYSDSKQSSRALIVLRLAETVPFSSSWPMSSSASMLLSIC